MGSIQKGCVIAKNEFGTLERVDGSNTCIGSTTLPDGKVITKRFRGKITDQEETIKSWEAWQGRKSEEEDPDPEEIAPKTDIRKPSKTPKKTAICPFSKEECGSTCPMYSPTQMACAIFLGGLGLYNIASNMMKVDPNDSLELIAMAVTELGKTDIPTKKEAPKRYDLVDEFFKGKSFMAFVNLTSKKVHSDFKKFCSEYGEECPLKETELSDRIFKHYQELERKPVHGGVVYLPRG